MRVSWLITALTCAWMLVGCSTAVTTSGQVTPDTTLPSTSVGPAPVTTPPEPTTTIPSIEAPIAEQTDEPTPEVVAEPYVLECLFGTPGPARWSDGSTQFSQWCFDKLDGDGYLRSEREANTFECDGTLCRNPFNGASYPDPDAAPQAPVGTSSTRGYSCSADSCYWPDGSFVIGADRCGIACGEPPTSGDIQTQSGCEAGYITDPNLCGN